MYRHIYTCMCMHAYQVQLRGPRHSPRTPVSDVLGLGSPHTYTHMYIHIYTHTHTHLCPMCLALVRRITKWSRAASHSALYLYELYIDTHLYMCVCTHTWTHMFKRVVHGCILHRRGPRPSRTTSTCVRRTGVSGGTSVRGEPLTRVKRASGADGPLRRPRYGRTPGARCE